MLNNIKSECFLSWNSESLEWNKSERKLLDDSMANWNIELELGTIIVVDRCATFSRHREPYCVPNIMIPNFLDRRTHFRMIENHWTKDKLRTSSRMIWESLNFFFQVPGRTKDIFLKESNLGRKYEFTGFGNLQIKGLDKWKHG
jgi:hypothetical protein